jgi:hypothetical protein
MKLGIVARLDNGEPMGACADDSEHPEEVEDAFAQ